MTGENIIVWTGYLVGLGGAFSIIFSKVKNDNLSDLKERVAILEKEREEARDQHVANQRAIANLEGQLNTYKEIPLKDIARSLQELSKSNDQILSTLQTSANTLVVDTRAAASEVKAVKVDLQERNQG
jgi:hypothetical protein